MIITRIGTQPSAKGPAEWFQGILRITIRIGFRIQCLRLFAFVSVIVDDFLRSDRLPSVYCSLGYLARRANRLELGLAQLLSQELEVLVELMTFDCACSPLQSIRSIGRRAIEPVPVFTVGGLVRKSVLRITHQPVESGSG